jgi:hypothetical protein
MWKIFLEMRYKWSLAELLYPCRKEGKFSCVNCYTNVTLGSNLLLVYYVRHQGYTCLFSGFSYGKTKLISHVDILNGISTGRRILPCHNGKFAP